MNRGVKSFNGFQKKVLAGCFIVYLCTYIGRLNMSATLDDIILEFGIDKARGGLLQTVFAAFYAAGQLVFGTLADRFEPKRLMSAGLLGSAACNLAFSFMPSFELLVAAWMLNGIFQSMIWTPIVLCMAYTFDDSRRKSASFVMSFTLAAGNLAAWALAMYLSSVLSWRWSYRLPAAVLVLAALACWLMLPGNIRGEKGQKKEAVLSARPVRELWGTGLVLLLMCCAMNGFVRDGVITWSPTILGSNRGNMLFSLIIPCVNMLGILLGSYLVRRVRSNIRGLVGMMMACVALPALICFLGAAWPVWALAVLLGAMSALLYGTNPLLTTLVPLGYDAYGRVGLVAGLIDCSIYLGSALAGTLTGSLYEAGGSWKGVYLIWTGAAVFSCLMALLASRRRVLTKQEIQPQG